MSTWRVGRKVPVNVYDGERPVCQCHTVADARRIVAAVNAIEAIRAKIPKRIPSGTKVGERLIDIALIVQETGRKSA